MCVCVCVCVEREKGGWINKSEALYIDIITALQLPTYLYLLNFL